MTEAKRLSDKNVLSLLSSIVDKEVEISNSMQLILLARRGISASVLFELSKKLSMTMAEFSNFLPVSARTLQRYDQKKILRKDLSDHIMQIARVYAMSVEVFGDEKDAVAWLKYPSDALDNTAPLDLLDTFSGVEMVLNELGRIEHGIFA